MTEIIIFFLGTVGTILTFSAFFIPIYLLFQVSSLSRRVRELENQISSPAGQSMVREPEPPTFTAEQSYSRREPSGVTVIEQSKQDTPAAESASAAEAAVCLEAEVHAGMAAQPDDLGHWVISGSRETEPAARSQNSHPLV